MILKYNEGSLCKVLCDSIIKPGKTLFQRFYISLTVHINVFMSGCKTYIGIYGCHLKCEYEGILLVAVGIDANNIIVPLAIAICEA